MRAAAQGPFPHAPEARAIADVVRVFTGVAAVTWLAVVLALALALARRRGPRPDPMAQDPRAERSYAQAVALCVGLTLVVIVALTGLSFATRRTIFADPEPGLTLRLTGHQ